MSLAFLSGCQRPYEMDYDFALNRDQLRFTKAESKAYFLVYSKSSWTVDFETPVEWARLSRTEGTGNAQVMVMCDANDAASRGVNIIVTNNDGMTKTIYLSQESVISDWNKDDYVYKLKESKIDLLSKGTSVSVEVDTKIPESMFEDLTYRLEPESAADWIKDVNATASGITCVVNDYVGTEGREAVIGVYFPAAEWDETRITAFLTISQSAVAPQIILEDTYSLAPLVNEPVAISLDFNWDTELYSYDYSSFTFSDDSWLEVEKCSFDPVTKSVRVMPTWNRSGQKRTTVLTCVLKDEEGNMVSETSTSLVQDTDINPSDAKALYEGEKYANCYMVETKLADTYWFDAKKPDGSLPADNMASAEILWQNVTCPLDRALYEDGRIYFRTVAGKNGNAVIVVKDADGVIRWSWHIWVAGTTVGTNTVGSFVFMDRNIGALSFEGKEARGLHFEWGRKDPFPGAVHSDEATALNRQKVSPDVINNVKEQSGKTIEWTIQNPYSYVSGSENSAKEDWYFDGTDAKTQNNTLWGDGTVKSIYDPCPYGYRVPSKNALDHLASALKKGSTFTKYDGVKTKDNNDASLYFPVSGWWQRMYNTKELCNVGTQGRLWSSTPSAANALNEEFYSSYVLHCTSATNCKTECHVRRWGCNVRCVKIN